MNTRCHLLLAAVFAAALPGEDLPAVGIRHGEPAPSHAAPPKVPPTVASRAPTLPRRPVTRAPSVVRTPAAGQPTAHTAIAPRATPAPRSAGSGTDAAIGHRDWSYPRSAAVTTPHPAGTPQRVIDRAPIRQAPDRAAVQPRGAHIESGALGFTTRHDSNREAPNRREFLNFNPRPRQVSGYRAGPKGRLLESRPGEPLRVEAGGFGHHLEHHWDSNTRHALAHEIRGRVPRHPYFQPEWHGYTRGWMGGDRWDSWQNYWTSPRWRPYYWWHAPAWSGLVVWIGGSNWRPQTYLPYDYGDTIVYQNDMVYQNGRPIATAEEYASQAMQLADVDVPAPPPPPANDVSSTAAPDSISGDWQPLGAFALATSEDADPTAFLQLAVSREGYISGTYHNQLTDETFPIQGSVDKKTQRAAWRIADNTGTVMEAGLYNLTQDQAPVLVHFGKDETENYLLVRMQAPSGEDSSPESPPPEQVFDQ